MAAAEVEKKKGKEQKKKNTEESELQNAINAYNKWKSDGKPIDTKNNGPKLSKDAAKSIVKVFLPKIAPTKLMKDYNGMAVCVKWLGNIKGGTTWENEMEHAQIQVQGRTRLF